MVWLQTFVTAAEEGNFRRTAERLHLAQPTVTMHIQKLEALWGVELFDRVGRNVQLSRAGRRFLEHAQGILARYTESVEDMARWRQGYEETIAIAVSPLIATTFLPRWIRGFTYLHPEIEFSIQVTESRQILQNVLEQKSDIGLTRLDVTHPQICCEPLYDDPLVLVAPRDEHDFDGPPRRALDILDQYTLFTHNHPEYWRDLLVKLRNISPTLRTMQVSQVHVCLDWITEKMGASFLPISTVRRALLRGGVELIPFEDFKLPTAHTYLLSPKISDGAASKFITFISEYMAARPFFRRDV